MIWVCPTVPVVMLPPAAVNAPATEEVSVNPQEDWGEPADEGATYSANHATRGQKPDRSSGPKTRAANKDQISRR